MNVRRNVEMPNFEEHPDLARYARQFCFGSLGEEGQRRLMARRALVVGCGALGSVVSNTLVRAGVGKVRVVDRDFLELSNLHRQVLFDETDVEQGLPKAIAAAKKLHRINSLVEVEPVVEDLTFENVQRLAQGADVIVDGTDNFETRLLLNDYAVSSGTPWIYGGVAGAEGQTLAILPGESACLRSLIQEPPPPGAMATCDSVGVLAPVVNLVASLQSLEAMKILSGNREAVNRELVVVDLWRNRFRSMNLDNLHEEGTCLACHAGRFPWLTGEQGSQAAVLCGRNAVQLKPPTGLKGIDLAQMAERLGRLGDVTRNPFLLRFRAEDFELALFRNGRAIISGMNDESQARSIYARYVGN